jgi:circadian clock protein KaiC
MSQEAQLDIDYIEKLETGIPGFDFLAEGGLPKGRATLISGTAGSAKTVFASQFLVEGIKLGENGVFVTFEEPPKAIRRNMSGFGWKIQEWEENRQWAFVDASPQPGERPMVTGEYDLGALIARIEYAIRKYSAQRVSLDSLGAIFSHLADSAQVRNDLFRLASALRELGVTAIMTAERTQEYGDISRYGVEEFVADNVVILRNVLNDEKRRRTIEILKYRGTNHQKGEYPFTIIPRQGVVIIPLSAIELEQHSSNIRITSGSDELDKMCGGGFFRDSIILVSGATGTGKTLMVTEFMAGGVLNDERCLVFAFEESREQLFRNATGWGVDFQKMEKEGKLKVVCRYPETTGLENHYVEMYGEMRRGITVLKMRGSMHDKDIREFTIDHQGMHIGHPFRNVTGILAGTPMYTTQNEVERLSNLFDE